MTRATRWAQTTWDAWFTERPAALSVALFSGLNLLMITIYAVMFSAVVAVNDAGDDFVGGVMRVLALAALATAIGAIMYAVILYALRPGRRHRSEMALLILVGAIAVLLTSTYLRMPFLSLAVVPIVARYWLSLQRTLYIALALIVWSVAWFAWAYPQSVGTTIVISVAVGALSVLFGGYTLLGFAFANSQARAREELDGVYRELADNFRRLRAYRDLEVEHAHLDERSRISRELHDTLGHHLTAQRFDLQVVSRLVRQGDAAAATTRALDRNKEAIDDLRRAVTAMRPGRLDRLGCVRALAELIDGAPEPRTAHLHIDGEDTDLAPELALTIYRIGQEALTNASKHAPGQAIELRLAFTTSSVELEAINPTDRSAGTSVMVTGGMGLRGLSERVHRLGGSFSSGIDGAFFKIHARLPR